MPGNELVPCPCRYGRRGDPTIVGGSDPAYIGESSSFKRKDIINTPNERLEAPAGGLWWIYEDLGAGPISATDADGQLQQLQVQAGPNETFGLHTVLAVPKSLAVGSRLTLGARVLSVSARPLGQPLDLQSVEVTRSYRVDLGGTGVAVTLPQTERERLFIPVAYVAEKNANPALGIQVLKGLRVSEAGALCTGASTTTPDTAFIPIWIGDLSVAVSVFLQDADHLENRMGLGLDRPIPPVP